MSTPYTYYLYHRPTKKSYYGAQWGKHVHPNHLWKTYFTSSSKIKELIDEYGIDSFDVSIRKTFDNPDKALLWEAKVIRRLNMPADDRWINQAFTINNHCAMVHNQEIRDKISNTLKGRKRSPKAIAKTVAKQLGRKNTEEAKQHMSDLQKAAGGYGPKYHTEESKKKMSDSLKGRVFSEEHKKNKAIAGKKMWAARKKTDWKFNKTEAVIKANEAKKGVSRDEETLKKIRATCANRYRIYREDGSWYWAHHK